MKLLNFNHSAYMVFEKCFRAALEGVPCMNILRALALKVKREEFYISCQQPFLKHLFDAHDRLQGRGHQESMNSFISEFYQWELAFYLNELSEQP